MRKKVVVCTIIMIFFANIAFASNFEENEYAVYINNISKDIHQIETKKEGDLRFIPLRKTAEFLGYEVVWNGENNSVEIIKTEQCKNLLGNHERIFFVIGNSDISYTINEEIRTINYPDGRPITFLIDGVTYISCGDFCNALDLYLSPSAIARKEIKIFSRDFLIEMKENT